jgi:hypothetical protein
VSRSTRRSSWLWSLALAAASLPAAASSGTMPVEILDSTGGLAARFSGAFKHDTGFVETAAGEALVLDAGAHAIYAIDSARSQLKEIVHVGGEPGHILKPTAFTLSPNDIIAVVDAPTEYDRLQYFGADGTYLNGFYVPNRLGSRVAVGPIVLNGIGSLQFNGRTFFVSTPQNGSLMMEIGTDGRPIRSLGALRPTGHESDAGVNAALNIGIPLIDPLGGFYFVFQTGLPMFRKYDPDGRLVFERHIEGAELDASLRALPTTWPTRPPGDDAIPYSSPLVRTAAVDPAGRLWISLTAPYTYIYDRSGEKIRVVQLRASGAIVSPSSLFFARRDRLLVTPGCYVFSSR